jgi:putative ABC transport system substrate-binding protein
LPNPRTGDSMTNRRTCLAFVGGVLLALPSVPWAQRQAGIRRIGFLAAYRRADADALVDELRVALRELGWTDGRNIVLMDVRTAEGRNDRLPSLAAELVAERPDLILVQSTPATLALMRATRSIPIVMVGAGNPVESGLVADLRKPSRNVTGSSYLAFESVRKVLELLKEAVPHLRSVALFGNSNIPGGAARLATLFEDAQALGLRLQPTRVLRSEDFERAFSAILRENTESLLLTPEALVRANREKIGEFARAHKLVLAVTGSRRYLPEGGLFSYGPTTTQYAAITARYVDRILRGAKPGDLPVEQPSHFELVVNAKVAAALGLAIPQSLLLRADDVIQ